MDFVEEYKSLIYSLLYNGEYEQAIMLRNSARKIWKSYDEEMCYIEALVEYSTYHFPLALFWAERGYRINPDYQPNKEFIELLRNEVIEFSDYNYLFPYDVSFLNKKLRIIIHCGVSPLMDYTGKLFMEVFEALGHDVFMFRHDVEKDIYKEFLSFASKGVDGSICFNNFGWFISLDGIDDFYEFYHVNNLNYLFDHPLYYIGSLRKAPKEGIVSCVDWKHVNFINRFFPNIKQNFFFPLGGEEFPESCNKSWKERCIDVLFVGTYEMNTNGPNDDFSDRVYQKLAANTSMLVDDAIIETFQSLSEKEMGMFFPEYSNCVDEVKKDKNILQFIVERYCDIDLNNTSFFREKAVISLANAGIKVTIYGRGWENIASEYRNIQWGGAISVKECIAKICEAKIVLNVMPWFKDGIHDRVANAMLNRAVCITDPTEYLLERYTDQEDIIYFSLDYIEELPKLVSDILCNENKAELLLNNAYQKAKFTETWQNRGIEYIYRLMNGDFI